MDDNVSYFEFWIILFITITFFILSHVTVLYMNWSYNVVALPANFFVRFTVKRMLINWITSFQFIILNSVS